MKKFFCLILIVSIVFLACSCTIYKIKPNGVYVSEDGNIVINLKPECSKIIENPQPEYSEYYGYSGKFKDADGSFFEISFESHHGDFIIWKHNIQGQNGKTAEILLKGKCRQKEESLILYLEDGSNIVLIKENP